MHSHCSISAVTFVVVLEKCRYWRKTGRRWSVKRQDRHLVFWNVPKYDSLIDLPNTVLDIHISKCHEPAKKIVKVHLQFRYAMYCRSHFNLTIFYWKSQMSEFWKKNREIEEMSARLYKNVNKLSRFLSLSITYRQICQIHILNLVWFIVSFTYTNITSKITLSNLRYSQNVLISKSTKSNSIWTVSIERYRVNDNFIFHSFLVSSNSTLRLKEAFFSTSLLCVGSK